MRSAALTLALGLTFFAACSKPQSNPPPSSPQPATEEKTTDAGGEEQPPVDTETVERPPITAADCEAQGGKVVGDIGDGAIHKPDYTCPDSGAAPIGSIVAEEGQPVAVEGAVCCK